MSKQIFRNRYGAKIGEITTRGNRAEIRDIYGVKQGEYRSDTNGTYDRFGNRIGFGDQLTRFL